MWGGGACTGARGWRGGEKGRKGALPCRKRAFLQMVHHGAKRSLERSTPKDDAAAAITSARSSS